MKLRDIRVLKKISQQDIAAFVGVSQSKFSMWERGLQKIDEKEIKAICKAMSIDPAIVDWQDCSRKVRKAGKAPRRTVFPVISE